MEKEDEIDTSKDVYPMSKVWADIQKDALGTYNAYSERKKYGEEHGKKMDSASLLVWQYCQSHPNATVNEVGEYLLSKGIDKRGNEANKKGIYSKIYDLEGWKKRKNSDWEIGKSSEIPNQNSEGLERDNNGFPIF